MTAAILALLSLPTVYAGETRDARMRLYFNQTGIARQSLLDMPELSVVLSGDNYECKYSTKGKTKISVSGATLTCEDAPTGNPLSLTVRFAPQTGPTARFSSSFRLEEKSFADIRDYGGFLVELTYINKEDFEVSYDP